MCTNISYTCVNLNGVAGAGGSGRFTSSMHTGRAASGRWTSAPMCAPPPPYDPQMTPL